MGRAEKVKAVERIAADLGSTDVYYLVDYRGISVGEATDLRNQLREQGASFKVIKNTLARRALEKAGIQGLEEFMEGPTAIAYCHDDPVGPAKVIRDFIKQTSKLSVKGGYLRDHVVSATDVDELAALPTREELVAKVVGGISAPLYGFANVMAGPIRGLVTVLGQVQEQQGQAQNA